MFVLGFRHKFAMCVWLDEISTNRKHMHQRDWTQYGVSIF